MDAVQFAKDLVTLRDYLEQNYGIAVRDKVLSLIDRKLSMAGKLVEVIQDLIIGQIEKLLVGGTLQTIHSALKNLVNLAGLGYFHLASATDTNPNTTPYCPRNDTEQYVNYLLFAYRQGQFRYMPLQKVYFSR
jgi:hypothetical protein